jgi:hypothetical protein
MRGKTSTSRLGLVLLLRGGMAAWMAGWSDLAHDPPLRSELGAVPFPDACTSAVVNVLTEMALSHMREAST